MALSCPPCCEAGDGCFKPSGGDLKQKGDRMWLCECFACLTNFGIYDTPSPYKTQVFMMLSVLY